MLRQPFAYMGGRGGFVFVVAALIVAMATPCARAGEVARGELSIVGLGLEVEREPVITAVDVPSYVQTWFGGKTGTDAPPAPGLSARADLTGPGIDAPITLSAVPGQKFAIPALHEKGEYLLQNVRLVGAGGEFLQQGVPSVATIQVTDVLQTRVKVRQLTPDELRERGIIIDDRNYEVYEYTFIFGVDAQQVEVPYPVIIDKRTREITPARPGGYKLPPFTLKQKPPRFVPPSIEPFDLGPGGGSSGNDADKEPRSEPVSLPAALVVPTGFGVLHQFFAVILQVGNNAPEGSNIRVDSITASIHSPLTMRVSKVVPAVSVGTPVPIVDERTGATFLVAGAQGSAEWTLEAMKAGTHTIDIDVRATYQKPGQEDFKIGGRVSTSIVVSDPRFHVNFSHPDVVRKDDRYTAYAFVTNLSNQRQHLFLDLSDIPACSSGGHANNVCRDGTDDRLELDIGPGEMLPVPHKLRSRVTGKVYAAAGAASDETVGVSVRLTMGVSESGIPLSPATLVMPYYAQFLPTDFVDGNMQLLGLGYSLATAPLTKYTAAKPRVITTDVFRRAQQIALAGQRVFTTRRNRDANDPLENRDAFFHLALDLLGNVERVDQFDGTPELAEWDELRRSEEAGRIAAAAMARQLETNGLAAAAPGGVSTHATLTPQQFVDDFAAATSHRTPFLFAYVHGPPVANHARPYALSVHGLQSMSAMHVPAEAAGGWVRGVAYGELTKFNAGTEVGELALVGRWSESMRITVVPAGPFTLHLLYPDSVSGKTLRTDVHVTNVQAGVPVTIDLARGDRTLIVKNGSATPIVNEVAQATLRVLGAAQDLHLDGGGHVVSLLFNRPIKVADAVRLRDLLALTINVAKANYSATRRNDPSNPAAELQIPAAVLQDDGRLLVITFDKTLSRNAAYVMAIRNVGDLMKAGVSFSASDIVPRVDNDRPGAILTGKVLKGDNTPLPHLLVRLYTGNDQKGAFSKYPELVQYDVSLDDGRYLFEYVPRDADRLLMGGYKLTAETADGKQATLDGAVRLPGEVHYANLVFLGTGKAKGQVRWSSGEPIANANVAAASPLYGGLAGGVTDANGYYEIGSLPVGPLVFSTIDPDGRVIYATNAIRTAGEVITQDLVAVRHDGPPPGFATVRVQLLRSDTMQPVAGGAVGVGSEYVQLMTRTTDAQGRAEFRNVPVGLMSIIGADFSISRQGAAVEVELRRDQVLEQTLVLQVADLTVKYGFLEGSITRDDPGAPGDVTKDQPVRNAVISIHGLPSVTASADGTYVYPEIPLSFSGRNIRVYDPETQRLGWFRVPTLSEGANRFPVRLSSSNPYGVATSRVRLYGGKGEPVAAAAVFIPGYPPTSYSNKGGGVYELPNLRVPRGDEVMAVTSDPNGPYGEQFVSGVTKVDFDGQIGITDLRLPGNGTVVVKLEMEQPCSTPPCYAQAIGPVAMTYSAWDDHMQSVMPKTIVGDPDPSTNLVTFRRVPARQEVTFESVRHPGGYDSEVVHLAFDGDLRNISLRLKTIGDVSGRVFAHDGITPVAGATVRITTGTAVYEPQQTKQDGSFLFAAIPANTPVNVVAELQQDGVFRTGIVYARTPEGGGPVRDLIIVMREQSAVEGRVVDNVEGKAVPLARYWLRELSWPYRSIGTARDPLQADINGRFIVSNVFTGPFRITAVASDNQEVRGDYQGTLAEEGDVSQRAVEVRIGGAGTGTVSITVVDPLLGFEPVPNAEVSLLRGGERFDFTTTNDAGVAYFEQVPVGPTYSAFVYSKQRGRSGASASFGVSANRTTSSSVQLEFLGIVSGTLTDPDAGNAPVRAQPITYRGPIALRVTSDADGKFEFNGVPEGQFELQAWELSTQRIANSPPGLYISKLVPEQRNIALELERMGTLTVKVYLPNDTGGPGELAPLAEVTAVQCTVCNIITPDYPYYRSAQGNPLVFPRMFRRVGYGLEVRELGGEARTVGSGGSFPAGAYTHEQIVVLPQSGTVEVTVLDGQGNPVADAEVIVNGGRETRVFTPASGKITVSGMSFGWYSAHATKGNVSAAASGELKSRSQPLRLTLNLGTNIIVKGEVDAEEGAGLPSVGTRVILTVSTSLQSQPLRIETLTDQHGDYSFSGIPVGNTRLDAIFFGPDDTTQGAAVRMDVPNGTTGTVTLPRVKLDATPPRVLSIDPPANATNVSPSSPVTITFSEQLAAKFLTSSWFDLIATDDGARVQSTVQGTVRPDGTYVVKVIPPPAVAPQKFPLKSNVLYRFAIVSGVEDTTGNKLRSTIGTSFTTVNYTEPAVVKLDPPETQPVPEQVTFRIKFNKAVDLRSFDAGNGGLLTLERLDAYKGTPIEPPMSISRYLDPADPSTIVVAPQGVAIAEGAFYRMTISGVRDTQSPPNVQKETKIYDLFAFDRKKPVVSIVSPVAADEKLVAGVLYSAGVSVTEQGSSKPADDVAYVDWLDAGGTSIARVKSAPFAYSFVAPTNATSFTLKATATDLSGNSSESPAMFTWQVAPNAAPTNITVANNVESVYPSGRVETRVRFRDEGVSVTVALELRGTATDGTELRQILGSEKITRASTSVEFAEAVFVWNAPLGLKDGTATVVATVTDSVNNAASGQTPITILLDQTRPSLLSFLPRAEERYKFGVNGTYTIELKVKDDETGIARAIFTVNGTEVLNATSGAYDAATRITTFRKEVSVPPKNADTRIPIVVTALDHRGNSVSETHEVIYERVDDSTLPRAAWITPLDGAALPSNQIGWLATLRVQASDDVKVTSVRFASSALAAPIELTAPKSGTTDIYETKVALNFPADHAPFVITATVADGDPSHDVELPITIDPVAVNPAITGEINITAATAEQYANKSVLVRGNVRVYISTPLALKDLILVDGARLGVPEETRLDLTITDRLFVDGDSRIDVSDKGYLGGLRTREDNSFTNSSRSGRTLAGEGATNADASHGGIGGSYLGTTNATYGSITEPVDFGSGGGAQPDGSIAGANGGGAVILRGGTGLSRLVVAGGIRADSSTVPALWNGGSGGSINVRARALITGPATRITANGADEGATLDSDLGGGGGRIALRIADRFDNVGLIQARGGRHLGNEDPGYIGGGAGTLFVQRPGAAKGELIVSAYDERHPTTVHRTAATPLAGTLDFDAITLGPRAFARFDAAVPANVTAHATASLVTPDDRPVLTVTGTTPAAGADVPQYTNIHTRFTAASPAGVREVRAILSVQPNDVRLFPRFVTSVAETARDIAVPSTAPTGAATLRVRVLDRAGRVAESAPISFNVVANSAPAIDTFELNPSGEIYAGRSVAVSTAAHDDVAMKSLALATTAGTVAGDPPQSPNARTMSRAFSVSIPPATPGNSTVVLTLTAADDFPGRPATTATRSITIRKDAIAPTATILQPAAGQQYQEGSGATFVVDVTAADAEVGVQRVTATLDGVEHELVFAAGHWTKSLPLPNVDGVDPVTKTLLVKAFDYEGNFISREVSFSVKPLIDPDGPLLTWLCTSPGAMYPVGHEFTIRVTAAPADPAKPNNGVDRVEITIGNGTPVAATRVGTSTTYEVKYTIPGGTADGAQLDVRVLARSAGGAESTLLGTVTAVAGVVVTTSSSIAADDAAFENQSLIVGNGGVVTITGPHTLRNVVVLPGGKLVQQHVDPLRADLLRVARLYVACGATIDMTGLGLPRRSAYPGAGVPDDGSGGSHIGRGTTWWRATGGVFGSVHEPKEPGGGGNTANNGQGAGGGMLRLQALGAVSIDGTVKANGTSSANNGAAGAGGSVWIATAGTLAGAGSIEAMGPSGPSGAGGGGAIALEYATLSGALIADARGGTSSADPSRTSSAGTVLKRANGTSGDLIVDNKGQSITPTSATELPAFGHATVAAVSGANVTLAERRWISPSLAGHRLRAFAPEGTVRGTYRLTSVSKHPTAVTLDGWTAVRTTDSVDYDGWLMYAPNGLGGAKFVAVRHFGGAWQYDNDSTFINFIPAAGDALFASFRKVGNRFRSIDLLRCCDSVQGLPVLEVVAGHIVPDATEPTAGTGLTNFDAGEIFLRADGQRRAFTLAAGAPALTLEKLSGADIQPGDRLRGLYLFDTIRLTSARVVTEDLVEGTLQKDGASSLVGGNTAGPALDGAKIAIERGLTGAVVVGAAGAVSDPNGPLEIVARNGNATLPPPPLLRVDDFTGFGTAGGFSIFHLENGRAGASGEALSRLDGDGYLAFSPSQTNANLFAGLAREEGSAKEFAFRLRNDGVYEVFANGSYANKNGAYTASTAFRIDKSAGALRWYVDNALVHELTSGVPATLLFKFSMEGSTTGEIGSIEYGSSLPPPAYHARVAGDGSFRVPVGGAPGSPIRVRARDRHTYSLESAELTIGTIPNDLGVATLTFEPAEVTGGRTTVGTVTLLAPAGSQGALVMLKSGNAIVTVPASITIAAGQSSGTFVASTTAVLAPVDVNVTATYAGNGPTTVLRVLKDNIAPSVTITSPAANSEYVEGQSAKIDVRATAADGESGVKRVWAVFDGQSYPMTLASGVWSAQLPVPFVDGTANVTKEIVVHAEDNSENVGASEPRAVVIKPIVDDTRPTIAWKCGSSGAMYPVGYAVPLRVVVTSSVALQKVEIAVTDPSNVVSTHAATDKGSGVYEVLFTVPDVADRSVYRLRATATTGGGATASADSSFAVVKGATEIKANTTLDASHANKSIVVFEGVTATINGAHTFDRLIVLGSVTHAGGQKADLTTSATFVSCTGAIDLTGRGYGPGSTYPGAGGPQYADGGSHIGRGALVDESLTTYGSITHPSEAGGGAYYDGTGGGVLRLRATSSVAVDGAIRATGSAVMTCCERGGGGGGSIWISTAKLSGAGSIDVNGGSGCGGGGGGALSIDYSDATSTFPALASSPGATTCGRPGSPGTIYVRGPAATHGDLTIDSAGSGFGATELPSLGKGVAQSGTSGATLVTDRAANIPAYFAAGHWVRVAGKGTWRIESVSAKSVTLKPNGSESISLAPGDAWSGLYRFDRVTLRGATLVHDDPIEAGTQVVEGTTMMNSVIANSLHLKGGAVLRHWPGMSFDINVTGELRVDAGGVIDATARGWTPGGAYPGAQGAQYADGGSHIGRGALVDESNATFGSIYRPRESGGGAYYDGVGGGIIRIKAGSLVVDGAIRARGGDANTCCERGGGGGGSIWITTGRISGSGSVDVNGGRACGGGGGGALAIEYSDAASVLPSLSARAGANDCNRPGGPGSIYVRGPASTYGDLTVDAMGAGSHVTELPSLGKGIAQSGSSGAVLVTDRGTNVPAYLEGHWVRIADKGTWRIASVSGRSVTLQPNGSESISIAPGDAWSGVYRFDSVTLRGATLVHTDPIEAATQVVEGTTMMNTVIANALHLEAGAVLRHWPGMSFDITVAGELRVDAGATIDAVARGWTPGGTYPGAQGAQYADGGSHIGRGALVDESNATFGSVHRPQESGGGAYYDGVGGGIVRIKAGTLVVDGAIRATGGDAMTCCERGGGSGGSVWITTGRVSGSGVVEANGGSACGGGGGGALAIEYTDSSSTLPTLQARAGQTHCNRPGGAGTVYVRGPQSTYGDVTVDTLGYGLAVTELPGLGKGVAQSGSSGATLVTDRAANVPGYFVDHWVRIAGKGTWRIASISGRSVTLKPNGSETISIAPGDAWSGLYRFDKVTLRNTTIALTDPIEASQQEVHGAVTINAIKADSLRVFSGATLTHWNVASLDVALTGELRVDTGGAIDVTARGWAPNATYPGAQPAQYADAGSHLGRGALVDESNATYGSVHRPRELGAGAYYDGTGGGAVRVSAGSVVVDGAIRAAGGAAMTCCERGGGAGGSVWITAPSINGAGSINADGGRACGGGGGGAIALEYTNASSILPSLSARAGEGTCGRIGGAGTIFIDGPSETYGLLQVDNSGRGTGTTDLPSLGGGSARTGTAGATLVTDRATDIPAYFAGHWVQVRDAAGTVKGTWRIGTIGGKSMTLVPNGSESISLAVGDTYEGVYRFDAVRLLSARLLSADPLLYGSLEKDAASTVVSNSSAPQFEPSLVGAIAVSSTSSGDFVVGPAGAVTDPDQPIKLTATNVRTGVAYNANANANGSFSIAVAGAHGDRFTLRATDSHAVPRTSRIIDVSGTIVDNSNSIASLTIEPATVSGGTRAMATLRFAAPMRSGGGTVTLTSSNSSAATVPASVTVAAGASTVQFAIETLSVTATQAVTITASYSNAKTATLHVTSSANALATLTLDAPSVESGASVNGTVTLGDAAPAGGALVFLASSDSSRARVPDTVVVPAGATAAAFTVTTTRLGASADVTISATWGATRNATLTLNACAAIGTASAATSTPSTIWFDDAVPAGATATGSAAFDSTQAAAGTQSLHFAAGTGARTWSFSGATALSVGPSDRLELFALVNPCNPPRQIAVTWNGYKTTWGEALIDRGTQQQIGPMPAGGTWTRLSVLAKSLGVTAATDITSLSISIHGGEAWFDLGGKSACALTAAAKPARHPYETLWFDDDAPAGATLSSVDDANTVPWLWDNTQAAIGTRSHYVRPRAGAHRAELSGATTRMNVGMGDVIFTYVLVDPCNPPREILLELHNGSNWERRAYWGEDLIGGTTQGELLTRANMGPIPRGGEWVRLEVPASSLKADMAGITGVRFTLYDGAAWFDAMGTIPRVNLALNKPAVQSSEGTAGEVAARVVDGDINNFNHTQYGHSYWQVDLGAVQSIDTIQIWNRGDCCQSRLSNFWLFVSDTPFASTTAAGTRAQAGVRAFRHVLSAERPTEIRVRQRGRYVRVQLDGNESLHIAEVQVWAPVSATRVNLAGGSPGTSHSSMYEGIQPDRAVDGRAVGHFNDRSLTHTQSEPQAWWEIDLGSVQPIDTIDLINRMECCADRLTNFYLFVSDVPFTNAVLADTLAQPGVGIHYSGTPPRVSYSFDIRRTGRYVRVQLSGTNPMTLSEVHIWSGGVALEPLSRSAPTE